MEADSRLNNDAMKGKGTDDYSEIHAQYMQICTVTGNILYLIIL